MKLKVVLTALICLLALGAWARPACFQESDLATTPGAYQVHVAFDNCSTTQAATLAALDRSGATLWSQAVPAGASGETWANVSTDQPVMIVVDWGDDEAYGRTVTPYNDLNRPIDEAHEPELWVLISGVTQAMALEQNASVTAFSERWLAKLQTETFPTDEKLVGMFDLMFTQLANDTRDPVLYIRRVLIVLRARSVPPPYNRLPISNPERVQALQAAYDVAQEVLAEVQAQATTLQAVPWNLTNILR